MGLAKTVVLKNGATATYQKIGRFTYDGDSISGEMHLYINKKGREDGNTPLSSESFFIPSASSFQSTVVSPYQYIYDTLMADPAYGFSGASKV